MTDSEVGAPLDVKALLAAQASSSSRPSIEVDKEDDLTYDLGRLYAYDPSPLPREQLAADRRSEFLLKTARDNLQLLVNKLFGILRSPGQKGVIRLPEPTTQLPREKPLPQAKPLTRWEKFANDKGIVKKKRSKMVWDEVCLHLTTKIPGHVPPVHCSSINFPTHSMHSSTGLACTHASAPCSHPGETAVGSEIWLWPRE